MIRSAQDLPPPVQEVVRRGKAAHGRVYLVTVESEGREVHAILRALTKAEVDQLETEHDELRRQEDLLSKSVLHPSLAELDTWAAGAVDAIMGSVARISGWDDRGLVDGMKAANQHRESMYGSMVAFVCSAFPSLSPRDVDGMTSEELLRHVALAQDVHGKPFEFDRWLDPRGWAKRNRVRMRRVPGRAPPAASARPGFTEFEVPEGAKVDTQEFAYEHAARSTADILGDPDAVRIDRADPNAIRRLIHEQRRGMSG